ncbi:M56 family metallopeptidase [Roseibium salinum]|nr:M56 family metallopeptidase [Roseibium salinum]
MVIPSDLLAEPDDLRLVLKHEFQHLRQGDVAWEVGLELLRPFFFWNPFFYYWKSEVERLRELACDQKVAEDAHVDLRSYCLCLLRAAQAGLRKRQELIARDSTGSVAAVALLEVHERLLRRSPAQKLRRRVEALMEPGRVRPHWGAHGSCRPAHGGGHLPDGPVDPETGGLEPGPADAFGDRQSGTAAGHQHLQSASAIAAWAGWLVSA